jgi:hypothetical protein
MTRYIDARNESISGAEALALYHGDAKPYPSSWYDSADEVLEYRYQNMQDDYRDALEAFKSDVEFHNPRTKNGAVVARYTNKRSRWAEFSSDVNKWANQTCSI